MLNLSFEKCGKKKKQRMGGKEMAQKTNSTIECAAARLWIPLFFSSLKDIH